MPRGTLHMMAGMSSNPYPRPKEHVPRMTQCELCDRELPTKDWQAHKNSKKHRQAEAKERGELEGVNSTTLDGDVTGFGGSNEPANTNEFGFGDAFANATTSDGDGWNTSAGTSTAKSTTYNNSGGGDQRTCFVCGETGHQKRDCPQAPDGQACFNCGETGHRKSDCPQARKPGAGGGGGSDRLCFNCNQPGHNKSDCPEPRTSGGGRGGRICHNCGEEGHMSSDCDKPRVMTCRNCDEKGHVSRECPKPRDWSRVKCRNCNNYGHGEKRCPEPPAENANGGWGDSGTTSNTSGSGWADLTGQSTGSWADDTTAAAENNGWGDATASSGW